MVDLEKCVKEMINIQNNKFTADKKIVARAINKSSFKRGSEYYGKTDEDVLFLVESRKETVKNNMPLHCAATIFSISKLRMLEYHYDFVDKFIDRKHYRHQYTDTDCFVTSYSDRDPFVNCIKSEMREEFEREKKNWLVYSAFDEKTKFLFKVEYSCNEGCFIQAKTYAMTPGIKHREYLDLNEIPILSDTKKLTGMLSDSKNIEMSPDRLSKLDLLNKKCYDDIELSTEEKSQLFLLQFEEHQCYLNVLLLKAINLTINKDESEQLINLIGKREDKDKLGLKGVQRSNKLTLEMFKDSLFNGKIHSAVNRGFRNMKNSLGLQLYSQNKIAISNNYDKAGLLEGGIYTYPLKK